VNAIAAVPRLPVCMYLRCMYGHDLLSAALLSADSPCWTQAGAAAALADSRDLIKSSLRPKTAPSSKQNRSVFTERSSPGMTERNAPLRVVHGIEKASILQFSVCLWGTEDISIRIAANTRQPILR